MNSVPATWMRGGTSKCWVFERQTLDVPGHSIDEVLLALYGSPDPRQINGVGGGSSTTSKAVILSPSERDGIDVDYTFAQVGIDEAVVDWGSNCGNCSATVAPYAIRAGWVQPQEGRTDVRVYNTNSDQLMVMSVPTTPAGIDDSLRASIPGVTGDGAVVELGFVAPAGRSTGSLLPSGQASDQLTDGDLTLTATLIDAGAPVVIVNAADLDLGGRDLTAALSSRGPILDHLDRIRRAGAVRMGLVAHPDDAARAIPKLAVVAAGSTTAAEPDITVRMLSMGTLHPALPITGSVALTLAARTPGTVVADLLGGPVTADQDHIQMLTPAGPVMTRTRTDGTDLVVATVRTYRRLVEGAIELDLATSPKSTSP